MFLFGFIYCPNPLPKHQKLNPVKNQINHCTNKKRRKNMTPRRIQIEACHQSKNHHTNWNCDKTQQ